jgi:glutamine amidotransferase
MCRMLFASLPNSFTQRAALVRDFLKLAESGVVPRNIAPGHRDGWGTAFYREGNLVGWYRSKESGLADAKRDLVLTDVDKERPDAILAHVRKMVVGEPAERNSHPFIDGRFSFAHNGMLGPPDQEMFRGVAERAMGETDSERYFHLVIRALKSADGHSSKQVANELVKIVRALRGGVSYEGGSFTSASSILTDGKHVYALREFSEEHPLVRRYAADDYYTLFVGEGAEGAIFICSEKLAIPDVSWRPLPNHFLVTIDLENGVWETSEIR